MRDRTGGRYHQLVGEIREITNVSQLKKDYVYRLESRQSRLGTGEFNDGRPDLYSPSEGLPGTVPVSLTKART